jgi:DNA-binding NtrC family response regulator
MQTENDLPFILVVDDEHEILKVIEKILEDQFIVKTALSAKEALNLIDEKIQIILADQRMPEMTGSELFKIVRQNHPNIVRILMTGYSDMNAIVDSINEGEIFRYVRKPWEINDLFFTLKEGLQKYKLNQSYVKLMNYNKVLMERNQKIALRLNKTIDDLYKVRSELDDNSEK